ncbi:Ig-like domain-containing protein, partial [Lentibacter algarum]|uniref:Ig-like domain-containing protein n=1 Tax=Lentibacter algarum TaxID=576131 RepID=UPI0023030B20
MDSLDSGGNTLVAWEGFGFGFETVAGIYWASDPTLLSTASLVTQASIESCGISSVSNLQQGILPLGETDLRNVSYLGMSFEGVEGGISYRYEYALSGITSTIVVATRTAIDNTPPTVTLSSTTTTVSGVTPFTVTATFDEDVTGFTDIANDVTITNGAVTGITAVSASVYTLSVTPTGAGDVSISIPAAAAQDLASNPNTASTALVIVADNTPPTVTLSSTTTTVSGVTPFTVT